MSATDEDPQGQRITELETELARLRGLLGLDTRAPDGHTRAWSPTLIDTNPSIHADVTDSSTNAEKLALYKSLFAGRTDVYAVHWENLNTGKHGWSPARRNPYSRNYRLGDCLPLGDDDLALHLTGRTTIGIYPLMRGDTTWLLACDFDKTTWVPDALAYLDACHHHDIPAIFERSRSGNGGHVWIFFTEPVQATLARQLGAGLLREAMTRRSELDLGSYDRLFPTQDHLPKAGFGNLIALPLNGRNTTEGNTKFLDPTTLEPWDDQWAFLASVARMPTDTLEATIAALPPPETGPAGRFDLNNVRGMAPKLTVTRTATINIDRAGLPTAVVAALRHLGSLANPEYKKKQAMRFSTHATPRYITCHTETRDTIHLPRGVEDPLRELLSQGGTNLTKRDQTPETPTAGFEFTGQLRPRQQAAFHALAEHDLGVLVAPPGAGKTVMACALIARHNTPTLVLVDRKELADQWAERLTEHLRLRPQDVGRIGGPGKRRATGLLDIGMLQTLGRSEHPETLFDGYGLVVVDECHHLPSASFSHAVANANVRRWLGLTATPYRSDGLEGLIWFHCGPNRHTITPDQLTDDTTPTRHLIVHPTNTTNLDERAHIQTVLTRLADDPERTAQIAGDVTTAYQAGRTCLVLTQRKEHVTQIVAELNTNGTPAHVLHGGLKPREKAATKTALSNRKPGCGIVLVATGSYLGEGFDWPELDTLFLGFPIAFKGRVVQYVGRLLRTTPGKHHVELHDYVDAQIPVLERMHHKRLPTYTTLGFTKQSGPF